MEWRTDIALSNLHSHNRHKAYFDRTTFEVVKTKTAKIILDFSSDKIRDSCFINVTMHYKVSTNPLAEVLRSATLFIVRQLLDDKNKVHIIDSFTSLQDEYFTNKNDFTFSINGSTPITTDIYDLVDNKLTLSITNSNSDIDVSIGHQKSIKIEYENCTLLD